MLSDQKNRRLTGALNETILSVALITKRKLNLFEYKDSSCVWVLEVWEIFLVFFAWTIDRLRQVQISYHLEEP